ncbi:muscle-specific protein 300 kDa-like isoform X2 [Antedon mediterranea]|uniref:muscle-specific protein 300 kDa-like isoform X2 n=1 Tax=Antedon mediterranea TaxID=105859 RepID=UPI003AF8C79A
MSSKEKKTQSLKFGFRLPKDKKKSKKSKSQTLERIHVSEPSSHEATTSSAAATNTSVIVTETVRHGHIDDREDTISEYSHASTVHSGLTRAENLVVRGEKVRDQIESVTRDLDNIESQIKDVDGKASKLKSAEVNRLIFIIETNLKTCDKNIHTLYTNVHQLHEDGYQGWERLQERIEELQKRCAILSTFEIRSRSEKDSTMIKTHGEGMSISKKKEEKREERIVVRDEIYIFMTECLTWIQKMMSTVNKMSYGSDVSSIRDLYHKLSLELENIRQYRANLDQCQRDRTKYSGEELRKYNATLQKLEAEYQRLLDAALRRLHLLEVLLEFSQDATRELSWLDGLGDIEAQWENTHPTIKEMEDHILSLAGEIERHRDEFNQVIQRGETMISQNHPGSECIKKYLTAMKGQWAWLIDFKASVEKHLTVTRGNYDVLEKSYHDEVTLAVELLSWMSNVEHTLGSMQPQAQQSKLLETQLQEVKNVHTDVQGHQRTIRDCEDSMQLFVNMHNAALGRDQIDAINDYISRMIDLFDRLQNQVRVREKHLTSALDSLKAVEHDLSALDIWFEKAVSDIRELGGNINQEKDVDKLFAHLDTITTDVKTNTKRLDNIKDAAENYIASCKEYKHILKDFRETALSRQFNRSYVEPSDPMYIRDRLNRLIADFNQLQITCEETHDNLKKIQEKHRVFKNSLSTLTSWLQQAENEMARLNREPVTTDRNTVQQRIEHSKAFNADVTNHARDIDQLRDDGKYLVHSHQVMKEEVDRTIDGIVQRYNELETSLLDHIHRLRVGLDKNQHLDDLIRWLEEKEKLEFEMEKGTMVVIKREPLSTRLQKYRVFEKEVSDYQDVIEAVVSSTSELINLAKPEERTIYQSKLDDFRRRHNNLISNLKKHGELLQMFSSKLVDLELEVEKFESWLLPLLQELEAKDIAELSLSDMDSKLQMAAQYINRQQLQYQKILSLARELFDHPRANNTTQLSAMMMNFKHNWAFLEAAHATRRGQFDQRKLTEKRYENMAVDVRSWLDRMQHTLDSITLKARDQHTVDMQLQQLKLTQEEIGDNEKLIDDINNLGTTLNNLFREHQVSIATSHHQKSDEVEEGLQPSWSIARSSNSLDGALDVGETKFDKELALINRRYEALKRTISGFIEDLALIRLWLSKQEDVTATKLSIETLLRRLTEKKPTSRDLNKLSAEIDAFLIVSKEVDELDPSILEVINAGETFLRENHDTLTTECYSKLQQHISELRIMYEKLKKNAAEWLSSSHTVLDELEQNQQDSAMLSEQYRNAVMSLQDLLDWIKKAENSLASEDPIGSSISTLMRQVTKQRKLLDDIQEHQTPVVKSIKDAQEMLQKYQSRLSEDEVDKLTDLNSELSHRFNRVNGESGTRFTQLQIASQDLPKFEEETAEFERWMAVAEQHLDTSIKTVNKDLSTMRQQHVQHKEFNEDVLTHLADLKFIIKAGEKIIEMSKNYEESLLKFRTSINDFQSVSYPGFTIIYDRLNNVTRRYDRLKAGSSEHLSRLSDVIGLQQLFEDRSDKFHRWLQETELALRRLISSGSGQNMQQQTNKLQLMQEDLVAHLQDIDQCKECCRELGDAEPKLEPGARRRFDDMVRRYNALDADIKSYSSQLHEGLVQSQSFQETYHDLLQWLELIEAKVYKMEKGTLLILKRPPLIENLQEVKTLEGDIESHQSAIRAFNAMAEKIIKDSEPQVAKAMQTKVTTFKNRYDELIDSVKRHGKVVDEFIARLDEFEKSVDQLEDWVLPVCDELDSWAAVTLDYSQAENKIKKLFQEQSVHQNKLKEIHSLGQHLIQDPKASDTSYVESVLTSVGNNWRALDDLLQKRSKQIESRIRASRKYNHAYKEVGHWLDSSEYKVKQRIPFPNDRNTLKNQLEDTKKFQSDVLNYKPTINDYARYGKILDRLTQEEALELHIPPRFRSLYMSTSNITQSLKLRSSNDDDSMISSEVDSPIQQQVVVIEQRYASLTKQLDDVIDLLHIVELCIDRKLDLTNLLDWVTEVDTHVNQSAPRSLDINQLDREFKSYQVIHGDVDSKKAAILDSVHGAEKFLSDKRHRLNASQIDDLQKLIAELRNQYKLLSHKSGDVYKKAEETLNSLRLSHDEQIKLQEEYDSINGNIKGLLDWVTQAETQMSLGQQLSEQVTSLSDQLSQHKIFNESVVGHQEDVLEACQEAQHFLRQALDNFTSSDIENLQKAVTSLRSRYNSLSSHSNSRLTKLLQARHDLEQVLAEVEEFETWMSTATGQLHRSIKSIGVDADRVKQQCEEQKEFAEDVISQAANLKFITLAGSNFVTFSKEYQKALAEFRDSIENRHFSSSFTGHIDSSTLSDRLGELNNRYKQLKSQCQAHTALMMKIFDMMQIYQSSSRFMHEWLEDMTDVVKKLVKEEVSGEPGQYQEQIDRVKDVSDTIILHGREVDRLKESGRGLYDVHDDVKPSVQTNLETVTKRYNDLKAQLSDYKMKLTSSLSGNISLRERLENLLRQIQDAEHIYARLGQIPIVLKKEPLTNILQDYVNLKNMLTALQSVVTNINRDVTSVVQSGRSSALSNIQMKLDDMNSRYSRLSSPVMERCEFVQRLLEKVNLLQREADEVEDWVLPELEMLQSGDINKKELLELQSILQKTETGLDRSALQYKTVIDIADELLCEKDVADSSSVVELQESIHDNWNGLKETLSSRKLLVEERIEAMRLYNFLLKEVIPWLASMERKQAQLGSVPSTMEDIQAQLNTIKPFRSEVADYQTKISKLNVAGAKVDELMHDVPSMMGRSFRRSSLLITSLPMFDRFGSLFSSKTSGETSVYHQDDSEVQQQMADINKRYKSLSVSLEDRENELEMNLDIARVLLPIDQLTSWTVKTKSKLSNSKQLSNDITGAQADLDRLMNIHQEILDQQLPVHKSCDSANKLLHDKREHFSQEQYDAVSDRSGDLKTKYNDLLVIFNDGKRSLEENMLKLRILEDERILIKGKLEDSATSLTHLVDWITQMEKKLGSQQPMADQLRPLSSQIDRHTALNGEIVSRRSSVVQNLEDVHLLLRQYGDKIRKEDTKHLGIGNDLMQRYEALSSQSHKRLNQLTSGFDDLQRYREECDAFLQWLQTTEISLDKLERSKGHDLVNLQRQLQDMDSLVEQISDQKGDLKFLKRASQRYIDIFKHFRDGIFEYRRRVDMDHSYAELPESRQIQNELSDIYERYTALKASLQIRLKLHKELINKHNKYTDSINVVLPWIQGAYSSVSNFIKEPLETEPEGVARQMEQVKTLLHDIVLHTKDIETLKDSGKSLALAQPDISDKVMGTVDDASKRYEWMEAQLCLRRDELERNLGLSRSVLDELDRLLAWLEVTEKKSAKVVNAPVVVKKDSIYEIVQQLKFYETDIDSHRPPFENVKESGRLHIQKSDHQAGQKVRSKLDSLTSRFKRLEGSVSNHSEFLQKLLSKFNNLHSEVTKFEDWMTPVIGVLESHDLNHMSLLDLGLKLMEVQRSVDDQKYTLQDIKRLANDITRDSKTSDSSAVTEIVSHLLHNWEILEELLKKRNQQLEEKEAAYKRFNDSIKLCTDWLEKMEERVSRLDIVAVDGEILKKQLEQYMPLRREHSSFSTLLEELNRYGKAIETLSEDQERMVRLSAQLRTQQTDMAIGRPAVVGGGRRRRASIGSELDFGSFMQDEGLSDIQRQIMDVQDRYQVLGEKLADREYDITTTQKTVQQYQMELNEFSNWLKRTAQALEGGVTSVESMDQAQKLLEKHEVLRKDINDHYKFMESVMELARELTSSKKDHPLGYDKINSQMKTIEEQWIELQEGLTIRGKDIRGIIDALNDFEVSWKQLRLWLEETEMIMSVFGPIGISPEILRNQSYQTEVYQKHFPSHEVLLENMKKSSQALINRFSSRSRTSSPINDKVNDVTRLWTVLYHKLEDRHDTINSVLQSSEKFHTSLQGFTDWLIQFGKVVKGLSPIGGSNEQIKKQIEETIALQRDAAHMNPQLQTLLSGQSHLLTLNPETTARLEMNLKLDSVQVPFDEYKRRLDERLARLEGALSEVDHLDDEIAAMIKWLESKERLFSVSNSISANQDSLRLQITQHQELTKELIRQAYSYERLTDQIKSQMSKLKKGPEYDMLSSVYDDLVRRWETVNRKAGDTDQRLRECDKICQIFLMDKYRFSQWLSSAEERQVDVGALVLRMDVIRRQQDILKQIETDINNHIKDFENTNGSANNLIEMTDVDHQYIKDDVVDITGRWKDMKQDVVDLKRLFESLSSTLIDFEDRHAKVMQVIEKWEHRLNSGAINGKDFKSVQEEIKALGEEVAVIQHLMDLLISKAPSRIDSFDVKKNVEVMKKRYDALVATLFEREKLFETGRMETSSFQKMLNEIHAKLAGHEDVLDQHKRAQDVTTLLKQIEDVKKIYSSLDGVKSLLDQATRIFRVIYDKGFLTDPEGSREQLDILNKRFHRMTDQITIRLEDTKKIIVKHDEFQNVVELILGKLSAAESQMQHQKAIGNDLETLKSQQLEVQTFIKGHVDPLVEKIKDLNRLGQSLHALCQAANVNGQTLQIRMKTITERWKVLNTRLSERELKLNEGLLRCGKFQDAYQSLFNWIKDTEELVSAQKTPSSDHRVIKAHLQEQLLLDRLITDRKASVQALRTMGEQLSNISDPSDRVQINRSLEELERRWSLLEEVVRTRRSNLEALEMSTRGQVHEREETFERRVGYNSSTLERNVSERKSAVGQPSSGLYAENGIRDTPRYARPPDGTSYRRTDLESRNEQGQQQFGRHSRWESETQNGRLTKKSDSREWNRNY